MVPAFEMPPANPVRVAAVRAYVDDSFVWAVGVAAVVSCHARRFSIHIGGSEMVPLSQGFVLPHKEKIVLLTPPLRAVADGAMFCAYQPVTHPLD